MPRLKPSPDLARLLKTGKKDRDIKFPHTDGAGSGPIYSVRDVCTQMARAKAAPWEV